MENQDLASYRKLLQTDASATKEQIEEAYNKKLALYNSMMFSTPEEQKQLAFKLKELKAATEELLKASEQTREIFTSSGEKLKWGRKSSQWQPENGLKKNEEISAPKDTPVNISVNNAAVRKKRKRGESGPKMLLGVIAVFAIVAAGVLYQPKTITKPKLKTLKIVESVISMARGNDPYDTLARLRELKDSENNPVINFYYADYLNKGLGGAKVDARQAGDIYKNNLKTLKGLAAVGDYTAMYKLGECYSDGHCFANGHGIKKNGKKSFDYYKTLSDAPYEFAPAQYELADIYYNGDSAAGAEKDMKKAIEYYMKAASQGDALASASLGSIYLTKDHLDYERALTYNERGAKLDNQWAQRNLGVMYLKGLGVEKDMYEAKDWLEKSAEKGNEEAGKILADTNWPEKKQIKKKTSIWQAGFGELKDVAEEKDAKEALGTLKELANGNKNK